MDETTTKCSECFYFKNIDRVKTCGLSHSFLPENTVGCYGGYKTRNVEAETNQNLDWRKSNEKSMYESKKSK